MSAINKLDIHTDNLAKVIRKFNAINPRIKNDSYECDFLLSRIMTPNAAVTSYPLHRHSFYELHIPILGEAEYLVGGEIVRCKPEKALLLPPNQTHRYVRSEQYVSLTLGFVFTSPVSLAVQTATDKKYIAIACSTDVLNCISYFFRILLDDTVENRYISNALLSVIIHDLFMQVPEFMAEFRKNSTALGAEYVSDDARIRIALQYISDNIAFPISANDVANHLLLSSRQLNRVLKSNLNISINRLINETRIKEAKRHIEQTDLTLSEIALRCGFNSSTHFNLTFKKITGITPTLYRQKKKKAKLPADV